MKVFGYIRVSSEDQKYGDGPERQLRNIQEYCANRGYTLVRVFNDEITGTSEDRPALLELTKALKNDEADGVVIEKLDRLARSIYVQEKIVHTVFSSGKKLESAKEGPDLESDDPTRKMTRQMFGIIAEYEKSLIVYRLKEARNAKKARGGHYVGRTPIDQRQPEVVDAILVILRANPKASLTTIAETLNRMGLHREPCKRAKKRTDVEPWTKTLVRRFVDAVKRKHSEEFCSDM